MDRVGNPPRVRVGRVRTAQPGGDARDHRDPLRAGLGDRPVPLHLRVVHAPVRLPGVARPGDLPRDRVRHHLDGGRDRLRHPPQLGVAARVHRGAADVADVRGDGLPRAPQTTGPGGRRGPRRRPRTRPRAQVGVPLRCLPRAPDPDHHRPRPSGAAAARGSPRRRRCGRDVRRGAGRARPDGAGDQPAPAARVGRRGRPAGARAGRRVRAGHQDVPALARHGRPRLAARRRPRRHRRRRPRSALARPRRPGRERRPAHPSRPADRDRGGGGQRHAADQGARRRRRHPRGGPGAHLRPLLPGRRIAQPPPRRRRSRPGDRQGDRRGRRRAGVGVEPAGRGQHLRAVAYPACARRGTSR